MAKTQEQRIEDAAKVIAEALTGGDENRLTNARRIAKEAFEAADRELPVWPTDASMDALNGSEIPSTGWSEVEREELRAAMLVDPIIRAAIRLRDDVPLEDPVFLRLEAKRLVDAVNGARL